MDNIFLPIAVILGAVFMMFCSGASDAPRRVIAVCGVKQHRSVSIALIICEHQSLRFVQRAGRANLSPISASATSVANMRPSDSSKDVFLPVGVVLGASFMIVRGGTSNAPRRVIAIRGMEQHRLVCAAFIICKHQFLGFV